MNYLDPKILRRTKFLINFFYTTLPNISTNLSEISNNNSDNQLHLAKKTFTNNRQQVKSDENQIALKYNDLDSQIKRMKMEIEELKQKLKQQDKKEQEIVQRNVDNSIIDLEFKDEIKLDQERVKIVNVSLKRMFTMKTMNTQSMKVENLQSLIDEYKIMKKLNHPNILKPYEIIINDEKLPNSILFEYCPMNLEEAVKKGKITKVQQSFIIYQIAEGMKYIHSCKIIHQNLKPSNILISEDGIIKISGFENVKSTIEKETMIDIYSFGEIVYFILSGGEFPENGKESDLKSFHILAQQLMHACWEDDIDCKLSFGIIIDVLGKNDFNLNSLSQQEDQQLLQMITQYKSKVLF